MDEVKYWVALSKVPGIGPVKFRRLVESLGDAEAVWRAAPLELAQAGLDRKAIEGIQHVRAKFNPEAECHRLAELGIAVVTMDSSEYPKALRTIPDPPPVLYVKGSLAEKDDWSIAVVGTRRATVYGRQVCEALVGSLARNGVTIVSGLARGIDSAAHRAALDCGGRTLAVLGHGLDQVYPPENRRLALDIVESGALVSEFPLGTRPDAINFPRRNRIISGIAMGTMVVEAGESSGALITADLALEQGRDVFAVPGSIFSPGSSGTNKLIKEGAKPVTQAEDIMEELNLTMLAELRANREFIPSNDTEAKLLTVITHEPSHIDEIGRVVALPMSVVASTLTMMELKGMVRQVGSMNYIRGLA